MVASGVGGNVIVTENVPSTSSASGPPAKVTIVSPSTVATEPSQPSTGSVIGSVTPSGKRMSSCTVGEPSQPCSTVKPDGEPRSRLSFDRVRVDVRRRDARRGEQHR